MNPCDQVDIDAGCCQHGEPAGLPNTVPAPGPQPITAMTACKAAPFVQKRIA